MMSKRRLTVGERICFRYRLFWKYGSICAYCKRFYDWRYGLTIDHVQPCSKGGGLYDLSNMVFACYTCNEAKGNQWEDLTPRNIDVNRPTVHKAIH